MEQIKKIAGLEEYNILAYSVQGKHKCPMLAVMCENKGKMFFVKKSLDKGNETARRSLRMEFKILKKRYSAILNPIMIDPETLMTNYLAFPTISYYINKFFGGSKYAKRAITWLADFHNEMHNNGFGSIHGDFSAYEILANKDQIIVFDWEDYEEMNDQLIDVYYFVFRVVYQNTIIGTKDMNTQKFMQYFIGDEEKLHPYLKFYLQLRQDIVFDKRRRIKAFELFLQQRLKRENRYYSIPRKDHFVYEKLFEELLNSKLLK